MNKLTGKEKLYFLINCIEDKRVLTATGQPILIHPMGDLVSNFPNTELLILFKKLQDDEKILEVTKTPQVNPDFGITSYEQEYFGIEITEKFDKYFADLQREPEYQKFTGKTTPKKNTQPLSIKSLEKLWNILQEIENKRGITPENGDVSIQQVPVKEIEENEAEALSDERFNMLNKLEQEGAIKDLKWPHDYHKYVYFKIGPSYFDIYSDYKSQYEKMANEYKQKQTTTSSTEKESYACRVTYSEQTGKVLINGLLLKKLRPFGENGSIFAYLYINPNQDTEIEKIAKAVGLETYKDLNKFVENLGFKKDFRKAFFIVSKNKIRFNNPVSKEQLKELGIEQLKIIAG